MEYHTISESVLYPAAGMLVMVIESCKQLADRSNPGKAIKGIRFREVSFHSALQTPNDAMGVESHLYLRPVKQPALETKASAGVNSKFAQSRMTTSGESTAVVRSS